jgi:hypothetical protein
MINFICFLLFFSVLIFYCRAASQLYLTNFAGNATTGYTGENIAATSAEMAPQGIWYVHRIPHSFKLFIVSSGETPLEIFLLQLEAVSLRFPQPVS